MKNIGIIGCGWLGLEIAKHLYPENKIFATTTSQAKIRELISIGYDVTVINFSDLENLGATPRWEHLKDLDSIIITVPFPKKADLALVTQRFENISQFIAGYDKQLFLMSSIGIYPQAETAITECTFEDTALEPTLIRVENLMKNNFPQVNILRLGGLMGNDRIFSNYKVELNNQVVNHIHCEDITLIIEAMIARNCSGKCYNVVAPIHPTKFEVYNFQKGIINTAVVEKPHGRKILADLLATELNFEFKHPDPKTFY